MRAELGNALMASDESGALMVWGELASKRRPLPCVVRSPWAWAWCRGVGVTLRTWDAMLTALEARKLAPGS